MLSIRLLIVPTGNPLEPLVPAPAGVPAFADAKFAFSVTISDSVEALPQRTLVDQVTALPDPATGTVTVHSPQARPIFTAIKDALEIPDGPAADTFSPQDRDLSKQIRKYLPVSYRHSFAFVKPRTSLAVIDDTYHCLMKCPPNPQPPQPPTVIGWGEALAFSMRQPRLAEALGMIVALDVPLDAAPRLEKGGWLWVELAPASDYFAQTATAGFLRSFATRVPELPVDEERPIFTPVIFPVSDDATAASALGNFDKVFVETIRFDDGFSKIVHARQPLSADILDEDGEGTPIGRDEGVQLAWDDEDILEGQNRALGAPPDGEDPVLAPRGVFGYRVDVRPEGGGSWTSLSKVNAPLNVGVDLGTALEERWSEVVPTEHSQQIWLPAWFVNWRGGSLVVSTNDEQRLMNVPPGRPEPIVPVDVDQVELRYGRRYEFRVRLADTTGGGPSDTATPSRLGESPVALLHMKRYRAPSNVEIDTVTPGADGALPNVRIRRPRLGYPEAVFAGGEPARASLLAQIAANDAGLPEDAVAPTIHDPDTALLQIRVLIRPPKFDPLADDEGFTEWYVTTRLFPDDPTQPLDLALSWPDAADYREIDISSQLGAEGAVNGPILLTTARDIRLEVRALGRDDLAYFGSQKARVGRVSEIDFHAVASEAAEADLLRPLPPSDQLRSVFMRPDPTGDHAPVRPVVAQNEPSPALLGRLAGALDLVADGPMLMGQMGDRMAFGCAGLTYHIAPDSSSIEFSDPAELAGQWINAVQVVIDRDWTWRGAGSPTFVIQRTVSLPDAVGSASETTEVGTIELMNTINVQAAKKSNRSYSRMLFLDAVPPQMGPDGLPYEMVVSYEVTVKLEGGGEVRQSMENRLPLVTRPTQVPEIVAAGIALTPYQHDSDYASTSSRIKRLWLEFKEPLADPRDAWFVKALTSTPDPMLLPNVEPVADPVVLEGVPLDPEWIRVITPGQVQDLAGLATMQRLEPSASSNRHFLLPLPPNTDPGSPELFSFYTYEIRAGHDRGPSNDPLWSTAQGRFGEALVLEGVQHPVPELSCSVIAEPTGAVRVRAPYASPYIGLRRVLPNVPNTEIWIVLYAQVTQADGSTNRNIQIDLRPLRIPPEPRLPSTPLVIEGEVRWSGTEIQNALDLAGLPTSVPISALAVELLPEPNGSFDDPLGGDLGQVRILRTSPLSAVERDCCTP
ncbi:hypothetical protein [Larkinella arboricola]